jgi:ATP-dependent Clp protease ATP-binding subunit ClpC
MDELFAKAGINDSNIDELTDRMNNVMSQMDGQSPETLFKTLISGSLDLDNLPKAWLTGRRMCAANRTTRKGELLPAAIGGESEDVNEARRSNRDGPAERVGDRRKEDKKRKFLDQFGTNLTMKGPRGQDRPDHRPGKGTGRVIQILNRRNKNNPVLLGEPGVGKTAIAEGLAVKISAGEVPAKLIHQEVYLLDMTAMVAGTQFRGQFESRMKGVVDDARRSGNVILVIDELHNIMGAGDAEGAMNAANILKPALAKGEIKVIGSTTLDEYRRFIEKDSALERRFQKVIVNEPSIADSIQILKGIRDYYEKHHHVTYSDEVIETAVACPTAILPTGSCRTRPSTCSTRRAPGQPV